MNLSINNLLIFFPLFIISYFLRLGESSFYLFDLYFVVFVFFSASLIKREDFVRLLVINLIFIIVAFLGLINSILSYNIDYLLDRFVAGVYRYCQFLYILGFFTFYLKTSDLKNNIYLKHLFLLSVSFPLFYSLFFYFFNPDKVIIFNRLSSYFGNPNFLGAFICLSIFPVIYTISLIKVRVQFLLYIFYFLVLFIFNLIYAGSNSYWMLSLIILILALISMSKSLIGFAKIIFAFLFLGFWVYFVLGSIQFDDELSGVNRTFKLLETISGGGDVNSLGSGELRGNLAGEAIEFILTSVKNIFFGIGLGQSPIIIGANHGGFVTAHNAHIVLFMEMGAIGYFYFMFILFYFILKIKISKISLCFLISYLFAMLATPHVYMPFLWGIMVYGLFVYKINIIKEN